MSRILVFVNIFVESPTLADVVQALAQYSSVEELYEVTGEYDIRAVVSAASIEEFRDFLKYKILKINGVRSTVTSVVFNAPKRPQYSVSASDPIELQRDIL
ncbi:MAG TPA: Lrp/AsnC ligand binding domain-containing protein [Candidatus Acidoferrales bacterium]|nr:Lrp/AsnC ligand binding domain-containing protein [Candidatus Acidoferrales bacterium]